MSYAAPAQVLEYFAPVFFQPLPDLLRLQQELNSLPAVPTVYTRTCGGVHRAGTSSLCCTCACHGVHRAGTSSVLRRATTSTGVLRACVFSLCRDLLRLQQGAQF